MITGFLFGIIAGIALTLAALRLMYIANHPYREPVPSRTGDCGND